MPTFRHPHVNNGQLCHGEDVYPIVDGLIDCPGEFAAEQGLLAHVPPAADNPNGTNVGGQTTGNQPPAGDTGIVGVNADKAREMIAKAETIDGVEALRTDELKRQGGARVSVMRAIDERIIVLTPPPAADNPNGTN